MKGFTKIGRLLLVLSVLALLPLSDAISQNFIMETAGATYNATCGGVIKMKSTTGQFVNTGSLNDLGTDEPNAIKGIVEWAATSPTQQVQGLFYEKLMLSGGANKTILDGVNIVGEACAVDATLPGYEDFEEYPFFITANQITNGVNDFQGTLTYLGGPVNIFPVDGDDAYNNLALDGTGPYNVQDGIIVTVDGVISLPTGTLDVAGELNTTQASDIAGDVTISGDGQFDVGTGLITFDGTLDITGNGELNGGIGGIETNEAVTLNGAGAVINVGTGDLTFNDDLNITDGSLIAANDVDGTVFIAGDATIGTDGNINFGDDTNLEISGTIDNDGDGSNLQFACSSTVTYNGTVLQTIMPTINTNPYGNLVLSGGEKVGGIIGTYPALDQNNIAICADFALADGNLDMITNGGYVNMLDEDADANYTALSEVVGAFRRQFTTAATGPYIFNNAETELTFTGAPDAAGYYQLNIEGGENPINYVANTDINRRIIPTYSGIGDVEYTLQLAYLADEVPGAFPAGLSETDLKYFEADGALTTDFEKLAGNGYSNRNNAVLNTSFGTIAMSGIIDGTDAVDGIIEREFTSGHDLVLRANNTMYSIAAGRWSNPNTWDEGRTPDEDDNVEVRNFVYVGIDAGTGGFAGTIGGATDDNTLAAAIVNRRSESNLYANTPGNWLNAARTITIANGFNGALVIGNEDNDDGYIFKTALAAEGSFLNANTAAHTGGLEIGVDSYANKAAVPGDNTRNNINGLWLINLTTGDKIPIFSTFELKNEGAINNTGIIEVGE